MRGTLWICGYSWRVDLIDRSVLVDGKSVHGVTDKAKQHIVVTSALSENCEQKVRSTLVHELLHAIIDTVGNEHPEDEEQCVQALETGFFSALTDRRNKWFWRVVLGEAKKKPKQAP